MSRTGRTAVVTVTLLIVMGGIGGVTEAEG